MLWIWIVQRDKMEIRRGQKPWP